MNFFFFFSTGLTVMYSFRLINFCLSNFMGFMILSMGESSYMLFSMKFLMIFSIVGGSMLMWLIFPYFNFILLSIYLKMLTLIVCFIGLLGGSFLFNVKSTSFKKMSLSLFFYNSNMWFMPIIFCFFFNFYFLMFSNKYKWFLDSGWMEFLGGSFFVLKFKNFKSYFMSYFYFGNFFLFVIMFLILFVII